jgi:hypothetical protein
MYDSLKDNPNFVFIAFTYEPEKTFDTLVKKYDIRFPIAHLPKEEINRVRMIGLGYPTSIMVDKTGKIANYFSGGAIKPAEARANVMAHYYPAILKLLSAQ